MQISDITSPTYSVNSNLLKLNSSSIAVSTPGCQILDCHLVQFEQFNQQNFHLPPKVAGLKKRLTIDIDEINDFQQQVLQKKEMDEITERSSKSSQEFEHRVSLKKSQKNNNDADQLLEKVKNLSNRIKQLEKQRQSILKENQQLKQLLLKNDQKLEMKQQMLEDLSLKVAELQSDSSQEKYYDQKLRQKQSKYRQLQKNFQKMTAMNKHLQQTLRESQKKIMQLQKQNQKTVCATQYENMMKVKQSSMKLKQCSLKMLNPPLFKENKQNNFANTVKSLDKKKPSTQPKKNEKSTRVASSNLNFAKKLQIKNIVI